MESLNLGLALHNFIYFIVSIYRIRPYRFYLNLHSQILTFSTEQRDACKLISAERIKSNNRVSNQTETFSYV